MVIIITNELTTLYFDVGQEFPGSPQQLVLNACWVPINHKLKKKNTDSEWNVEKQVKNYIPVRKVCFTN